MADETTPTPAEAADGLNSPNLSTKGKMRQRAIKDEKQAADIIKREIEANRDRSRKNGRIMAKYNSEKPYNSAEQAADGLLWKANFSTQPLATLIDRIAPRFVRALNSARYLTSAKLPDSVPGAAAKSTTFQKEFTKLVRSREGAEDFWSEVAQENALFGYTCAAHTDEYSWMPRHFRQDEFMVPAGTKHHSSKAPMVILKETLYPNELFDLIEDTKSASDSGWNLENTVDAINNAMPDKQRSKFSESVRKYEDLYRETGLGTSLSSGAKVVNLYHLLVTEVTGKVSHYILDDRNWKQLFKREDQFDSMSRCASFFSFQQANGNLQGSKGVGRTVYTLAGIIDRTRNEVVDRLQLSGKIIVQGDPKDIRNFKMSVVGNAIVITKNFTISSGKIDAGVEPFLELDKWVMNMMDELGGNLSPASASGQLQGERVTNGQINYLADLQAESKDIKISRFLTNAATTLSEMQRRASSTHCDDEDAKEFRAACLRVMDKDELKALAEQPASRTVDDYTEMEAQRVIAVTTEVMADPLINHKEALRRKLTAAVDDDFAEALLLPDEDPTVTAEQSRNSQLENLLLGPGTPVAVSPRDADEIHLKNHMALAEQLAGQVAADPNVTHTIQNLITHLKAHVQSGLQKGVPKDKFAAFEQQIAKMEQGVQTVAKAAAEQIKTAPVPRMNAVVPPPELPAAA